MPTIYLYTNTIYLKTVALFNVFAGITNHVFNFDCDNNTMIIHTTNRTFIL